MMSISRMRLAALVLSGALVAALPAFTQDLDPRDYILDLEATVLDLVATVRDMSGESRGIPADAQQILDHSGNIEVRESGDDFILSVASDVLFGFDSADLSHDAQSSLNDIATVISRAPEGQVLIVGHTDSKGSETYNLALSKRRAEAVASFLRKQDVPKDRLRTEGRGETDPVAENEVDGTDNPAGRAKNRRVEFVLPKSMLGN